MGIEFSVKVNDAFTIAALALRAKNLLSSLLGYGLPQEVLIIGSARAYMSAGDKAQPLAKASSHSIVVPSSGSNTVVLAVSGGAVEVSFDDFGDSEDAELGKWVTVAADLERAPTSYILAIAVALAAAQLTSGMVVDESGLLGGGRIRDPDELLTYLAPDTPISREQAINQVLSKTRLASRTDE